MKIEDVKENAKAAIKEAKDISKVLIEETTSGDKELLALLTIIQLQILQCSMMYYLLEEREAR